MPKPTEILVERIDQRLAELGGKSRYWLSMQISEGRDGGIIKDIARRGTMPGGTRLALIAQVLETTTDFLLGKVESPDQVRSEVSLMEDRAPFQPAEAHQGIPLMGGGDCAEMTVEDLAGTELTIERSSFDPDYHVRYVERPLSLRGDRGAYAVYFDGSSMEPRFWPGEIGLVQPSRPARSGDFVVVQLNNGRSNDVVAVIVKRLVRQSSTYVELEQYNPAVTFRIARSLVVRVHPIVQVLT